jgi:hypothetical protein
MHSVLIISAGRAGCSLFRLPWCLVHDVQITIKTHHSSHIGGEVKGRKGSFDED